MAEDLTTVHNDDHQSKYVYANFSSGNVFGAVHTYANVSTKVVKKVNATGGTTQPSSDPSKLSVDLPSVNWYTAGDCPIRWTALSNQGWVARTQNVIGMPAFIPFNLVGSQAVWLTKDPYKAGTTLSYEIAHRTKFNVKGKSKEAGLYVLGVGQYKAPDGKKYYKVLGTTAIPLSGTTPNSLVGKLFTSEMVELSRTTLLDSSVNDSNSYRLARFDQRAVEAVIYNTGNISKVNWPGLSPPTFQINVGKETLPDYPGDGGLVPPVVIPYPGDVTSTSGLTTTTTFNSGSHEEWPSEYVFAGLLNVDYDANNNLIGLWNVETYTGQKSGSHKTGTRVTTRVYSDPNDPNSVFRSEGSLSATTVSGFDYEYTSSLLMGQVKIAEYKRVERRLTTVTETATYTSSFHFNSGGKADGVNTQESADTNTSAILLESNTNCWMLLDSDSRFGSLLYATIPSQTATGSGGGTRHVEINSPYNSPGSSTVTGTPFSNSWVNNVFDIRLKLHVKGADFDLGLMSNPDTAVSGKQASLQVGFNSDNSWTFNAGHGSSSTPFQALVGMPEPCSVFARLAVDFKKKLTVASAVCASASGGGSFNPGSGVWTVDKLGVLRNITSETGLLTGISYAYTGDPLV